MLVADSRLLGAALMLGFNANFRCQNLYRLEPSHLQSMKMAMCESSLYAVFSCALNSLCVVFTLFAFVFGVPGLAAPLRW